MSTPPLRPSHRPTEPWAQPKANGRSPEGGRQHGDLQYRLILRAHALLEVCRGFHMPGDCRAWVGLYEAAAYGYAQFSRTSCRWRPQSRWLRHHEQAPRLG